MEPVSYFSGQLIGMLPMLPFGEFWHNIPLSGTQCAIAIHLETTALVCARSWSDLDGLQES